MATGRRVGAAFAAAIALLSVAVGCSGDDGKGAADADGGSPEPSDPGSPDAEDLQEFDPPLGFDASSSVDLPDESITSNLAGDLIASRVTLDGATAYVVSDVDLQAISATTGEVEWSVPFAGAEESERVEVFVEEVGPRAPLVSDDATTVYAAVRTEVPGSGSTPGHHALSVLAVEAGSGEVAWSAEVAISRELTEYGYEGTTEVVGAGDGHVIVSWAEGDVGGNGYTVAIDEATQDVSWDDEGFIPAALVQDAVVGLRGGRYETQQLQALDIRTGDSVVDRDLSDATLWPAGPDNVAVRWTDVGEGGSKFGFLDVATGELTEVAEGTQARCVDDETAATLVCFTGDGAAAYDTGSLELLWSLPDETGTRIAPRRVLSVWHGVVYAEDSEGNPYAVDARTGEDLAVDIGAAPFQVSTTHGIWFDSDGPKIAPAVR